LPSAAVGGALYAAASLLIISLGESMRRARDQYREAESRAQERAAALQRADQNKTEFLATLAHELRNPLAPIRSGITLLGLTKDENVLAETRLMMDRQVTQLTRLVDDLVDVSRINRGMLDLRRQPTSMQAVLQSAFDTVQPILKAKRHNVQMNISGEPLYVDGDQARLSQVFSNLLQNAAKFTPVGGHIEVAMGAEGDFAVVSVTDSGVGIDRENLQDIFDLFVQLQPSRTQGGMGLGLAIARSIVQRHGGAIEAFSEGPGHGAKFLVQLPLVGAPVSAPAASEVRRSPSTEEKVHRNALIVDDNLDHASIIAELLRAHGHRVDVAEDGAAALQAAKRLLPDVAFIDLNMDGIDGYEVARRIRAMPLGRDVQLIALTGMGQARDMERTKSAGFDHHLVKPADPDVVLKLAAMARQESIQP